MDSLNLSDNQKPSLNSKKTSYNRNPTTCGCCGSKYLIQILPQPYCFSIQNPNVSKCKHSQECFEESFSNPQPSFSSFPLLHPFFQNSPFFIPFYAVSDLDDGATKQDKKKCENERENPSNLSKQNSFCQRENNEFKGNNENSQKYSDNSEPELQIPKYPFHFLNPNINSTFQPSGWGDFIPWTCGPLVAPMIPYYFLWNSQKINGNNSLKSYTSNLSETWCQRNHENTTRTNSSADNANEEFSKGFERECEIKTISSTDIKHCEEGCSEAENYENNNQSNSDSLKSEFNCSKEISFKNTGKEEEIIEFPKSSDSFYGEEEAGEDAEMEGFDSEVQLESEECLKINGRNLFISKTSSCLSIGPHNNIKTNRSQPVMGSEISFLMTRRNSENVMDVYDESISEMQVDSSYASTTDENTLLPFQENETVKEISNAEITTYQERITSKKTFKNFTIADKTNHSLYNEDKISVAEAAGDLGGENCPNYKVTIASFEKEEEAKTVQETEPAEVLESKKLALQDFEDPKITKSNVLKKNFNQNSKSVRGFKSGIAKLSNNSKVKETKIETIKNIKHKKESNQKEADSMKRKQNCFLSSNGVIANEKNSKIHKTTNCTIIQQSISGPEKQNKQKEAKSQCGKRG